MNDNHVYEYYLDLNISYQALENTLPETLIENDLNHFETTNESVQVVKLNRECFKINSSIGLPLQREYFKVISLELDFNIYEETLPKKISIYFTSEENAYGAFNFVWKDGEAFEKNMKLGEYDVIELTPYEYFYLDDNDQCSHNSFIQQWQLHLIMKIVPENVLQYSCPLMILHFVVGLMMTMKLETVLMRSFMKTSINSELAMITRDLVTFWNTKGKSSSKKILQRQI